MSIIPNNHNGVDLGTYILRVLFRNGTGYLHELPTGQFVERASEYHPLDADILPAPFTTEDELAEALVENYLHGRLSCDCGRKRNLAKAQGADAEALDALEQALGCDGVNSDEYAIDKLELIRPGGSTRLILDHLETVKFDSPTLSVRPKLDEDVSFLFEEQSDDEARELKTDEVRVEVWRLHDGKVLYYANHLPTAAKGLADNLDDALAHLAGALGVLESLPFGGAFPFVEVGALGAAAD